MLKKIKDYFSNPAVRITIIWFCFAVGATWGTLNSRVDLIEEKVNKIDELKIEEQLTALQIDVQWIKLTLDKIEKKI